MRSKEKKREKERSSGYSREEKRKGKWRMKKRE